jgi:hypothetical protein
MKDRMWTDGGISRYNICYACIRYPVDNSGSGKGRSVSKAQNCRFAVSTEAQVVVDHHSDKRNRGSGTVPLPISLDFKHWQKLFNKGNSSVGSPGVSGPLGSGSISQMYGSGSGSGSFPFLIKVLSGLK